MNWTLFKNLRLSKGLIKKVKGQAINKYSWNISDKGFVCKICKELYEPIGKISKRRYLNGQ